MESDTKLILFIGGLVLLFVFSIIFGSMYERTLKNECVVALKDKPAIEIQAVCK